jgi:hypothetical protein
MTWDLRTWWDALPRKGWQQHAACAGMASEPFFSHFPETARRICATCPVADDCLVDALRCEPMIPAARAGVFGGMTPTDRQRFARLLEAEQVVVGDRWFARLDRGLAA